MARGGNEGCHRGGYKEYRLIRSKTIYSGKYLLTFRSTFHLCNIMNTLNMEGVGSP